MRNNKFMVKYITITMKEMKTKYLFSAILGIALVACESDLPTASLNPNATLTTTASDNDIVLTEEMAGDEVLTISWDTPDFGFTASPSYTIYMDKAGDFSDPKTVNVGASTTKTFMAEELNGILLNLDFEAEESATLNVRVDGRLTTNEVVSSEAFTITVTPYSAFLNLSTPWGVVGGAYNNWGNGPDAPFFTTSTAGVIVAYVKVRAGLIKFRQNNSWDVNVGDNGADGTLEAGGSDITVTAGSKKITFNTNNNTYTIENYSWGIVGSAWNNWGNPEPEGSANPTVTPDLDFYYDDSSDTWKAIGQVKTGQFKIRKNNDWGTNYGDNGANGSLEAGGTDISITAGKYLFIFDEKNLTLTIEPADHAWGLVGSAWNNWGQDVDPANGIQDKLDAPFVRDWRNENIWTLKNIVLETGAFKIRDANNWSTNYGDNGANGSLEEGGSDINVTGGLHSITLDFTNPASPTIVVTRHND